MSVEECSPPRPTLAASDADHRDLRLDACRGLALCFVFLDHVPDNILSWLTLRSGALQRQGWRVTVVRVLQRGWEIYVAFLLLLLTYLALVQLAGGSSEYLDATNTAAFFKFPAAAAIRVMTMQYMPVNTDVLPTFVLLHLSFPALLWLLRGSAAIALAASIALYAAVQLFGWNPPTWPRGEWYFNPLAWEFLFVFGAWYATEGAARLQPFVQSNAALWLAALYLAFSFAVALSWHLHALEAFMPEALSKLIYPIDKSDLAPVRLLHFLALALVVGRLVRRDWRGLLSPLMIALVRCGENSLAIYCLGVLLSFVGLVVLKQVSDGMPVQVVVSLAGIALMIAAATLMTWTAKLDRYRPKLF